MFPDAKFLYLIRNPYTVFESTRNFFTHTIRPLRLQTFGDDELERNFLEVYRRLYFKYEKDKHLIPPGNLMELKFEDFEADPLSATETIYHRLNLPGFSESKARIEACLKKKQGYRKNRYAYDKHTIKTVEENWAMSLQDWNYSI
jgi:hypothetical protein